MSSLIDALLRHRYAALVLVALVLLGIGINSYSLRGSTEPREAGIAAEMLQDEQFITPKLNGSDFLEKPPLSYWLQAASLRVFGYQPFAVRLPSIIAGVACLCLLAFSLRKIGERDDVALLGGLLLLTMASFWMNARMAGQDILLTFGVALSLFAFNSARTAPANSKAWFCYALGIAIATFTKGVVGLAVPGVVIFAYLIFATVIDKKFAIGDWLRPGIFAVIGLLPLASWLYVLAQHNGIDAVRQILWSNSVERFSGDYQANAHAEPFYYYVKKFPETFAPWNLLLPFALWHFRTRLSHDKNYLFFFCWLLAPYVLLSLSAGKRPPYLLMIYPAAATLVALFVGTFTQTWRRGVAYAVAAMLVAYAGYGATLHRDKKQDSPAAMFAQLSTLEQAGQKIVLFNPIERIAGATNFYLQHSLPEIDDAQALQVLLDRERETAALIAESDLTSLQNCRVIARFENQKRKYLLVAGAETLP